MIPILSASQIRECDQHTIENTPIASIELMERASISFTNKFRQLFGDSYRVVVVAGTGNNGGDALAIARLLRAKQFKVRIFLVGNKDKMSPDCRKNLERLTEKVNFIKGKSDFPKIERRDLIVDGIFGSGLTRPVSGPIGELIEYLNESEGRIVSVDIASGLFADKPVPNGAIIKPMATLSFQLPKLAFFQPSLAEYVGEWHVIPIGLDQNFIQNQPTDFYLIDEQELIRFPEKRPRFSHKGNFGKVQLICGSRGKIGAAILAGRSAFRTGTGLLFTLVPQCGVELLHHNIIEGMTVDSDDKDYLSDFVIEKDVDCIGIGPGLGTKEKTREAFRRFLSGHPSSPLVLDADALNIIGLENDLFSKLPKGTIMTPHPGEFRRLVGDWTDDFDKLDKLRTLCKKYRLNIVLKGAFSAICNADGKVVFNNTGNPGMSTAGSGDVLFGMICSLVGQGIEPELALQLGVYLHGAAGDHAAEKFGERSVIASDIVTAIPMAFQRLLE